MEAFLVDWLSLFGRWLHLITGIAWIGASLYFVWLDNHLVPPKEGADAEKGVGGELWAVHGGGFYHAQKYRVAPPALPEHLHWFKWEAYWTWMSGMFLLVLIYWYNAEIYLVDPNVAELSKPVAIALSAVTLAGGWLIYDLLCKSPLAKNDRWLGGAVFLLVFLAAFLLCQVFSGRGAYIHFGAMLGTIMVANVFFVIIPGQRALVDATKAGRVPDPAPGVNAKQRSVHNTYFTLPVLFVMISNHYASTYGHEYNWLILLAISMAGALIRVVFVARHFGKMATAPAAAALLLLVGAVAATLPKTAEQSAAASGSVGGFAQVLNVVRERCASCHASVPTQPGFTAPPLGVIFDTPEDVHHQAAQIHQQTVTTKAMPIGNLTQMTEAERALIDRWFQSGAGGP